MARTTNQLSITPLRAAITSNKRASKAMWQEMTVLDY
jgi:hypothetical protein